MYAGQLVEEMPSAALRSDASHPYTRRLLESVFSTADRGRKQIGIEDLSLIEKGRMLEGCPYQPRCPEAMPRCADACPALADMDPGHRIACYARKPGNKLER
jgi:oligopeptide/dipeptide ABC transporter ATP-binding protein